MKYKLVIRSCAEQDITDAVLWYEKRVKGLGAHFIFSVDATIQSIQRNPKAYPKAYKNLRRALLRRFPYGIYYFIKNEFIIVIAVYHEKRNPEDWMKRA